MNLAVLVCPHSILPHLVHVNSLAFGNWQAQLGAFDLSITRGLEFLDVFPPFGSDSTSVRLQLSFLGVSCVSAR